MKLVIGLGNPGREYAHNRHNIGFLCINYLSRHHSIQVKKNQCQSQVGAGIIAGEKVLLTKPKTFMNRSGDAVSRLMRQYKVDEQNILIIYDDINLPLGKLRIRSSGSAGGHNGLKSIIAALGSQEFPRIKIGIGRPPQEQGFSTADPVVDHVLSDFLPAEETAIRAAITRAAEAVECLLSEGVIAAMNKFN